MADDAGNLAFLAITGIAGAVIGGVVGYAKTGTLKGTLAGLAIGGALGLAAGAGSAYLLAGKATASTGAVVLGAKLKIAGLTTGSKGFSTFQQFKRAYGAAGKGNAWHHIVSQKAANINRFGAEAIHRASNLVKLPHGTGTLHNFITSHYNSIKPFTNGLVVHKWLESQSYRAQLNYGLELLAKAAKEFGVAIGFATQ